MSNISSRHWALLISLTLFVSRSGAQDFFNAGVSARTAANAGIYTPSSGNALDALSLNPAGLSDLGRPVLDVSVMGLLARGSFSNSANTASPMRFNGGATPFFAFGAPVAYSRWSLASGFLPDLLSSSKWQFHDAPGFAGADYGPQHERSAILAFRIPVGVAYQINPSLSVGASVSAIYNANRLVMPYVFQSNPALKGLKTLLDLHTTGFGWNSSFGLVAKPVRTLELSASYRTRSSVTSTGSASGNLGAQFAVLGLPFSPLFSYHAQVQVELPQAAFISMSWQKTTRLRLSAASSWTNWKTSFHDLPVSLSNGSNSAVNSVLNSTSLKDTVPLSWKDQFSFRAAAQRSLTERVTVSGGFVHATDPVPSSTLSPLTAAIMSNGIAAGIGYGVGRSRFDLAYQLNFTQQQSVGTSALLSGEFNNSRVRVGTQGLTLSTSRTF